MNDTTLSSTCCSGSTCCGDAESTNATQTAFRTPRWTGETDSSGNLRLEIELPGVDKKDIELSVLGDKLSLTAKRVDQPSETWRAVKVSGLPAVFQLQLRLKNPVSADTATAAMENGLLIVTLPKPAGPENRSIEVN